MAEADFSIRRFSKNFLKYSPSSIIPAMIGFLTIPFLAKIFNPTDYGNYVLVISIVNFLAIIINAVCGDSTIRFFTVYKIQEKLESFYDSLIIIYVLFIGILVIILFISLELIKTSIDPVLYYLMLFGIPLFIFTTAFFVSGRLLVAKEESGIYSLFISLQSILGFIFSVILIITLKTGIYGIIWGYIISFIIFLPIIYYYAFKGNYIGKKFSKPIFIKLLKYGIPVAITNLSAWILSFFDRYVLGYYWGSAQVGIYSASYSLSETTMVVLLNVFMLAGFPAIVKIWENKGKISAQNYISKLTRYYLLIAIPAAVGLSVLSKPIIEIITSPAYYSGYVIVPLVVFGALLLGLQWWAQLGLLLNNKTHIIAIIVLVTGIFNILTNFLFIPTYSYIGAAISTVLSYLALLILITIYSKNYLKWRVPKKSLMKIALSSLVMGILIYLINSYLVKISMITLIVDIFSGILIYLFMIYIFKELTVEEKLFIKELIHKITRL